MATKHVYIGISLLHRLSCEERMVLLDSIGSKKELFGLSKRAIEEIVGRRVCDSIIPQEWERESHTILELQERNHFRLVRYWDRDYPPQLREIHDPPFLLYVQGTLPDWNIPTIAVVGTRRPSENSLQASFQLGAELSLAGLPVVSGLAKGIDGAAHWGVVKTGGMSMTVEATGLDRVYPKEHESVARKILENGGCRISEYPPASQARRYHFPERNRIIAGLARAVVVVQAPEKSGALITAEYAVDEGRDLLVHRKGLRGTLGAGGERLVEEGARIIDKASDIVGEWREDEFEEASPQYSHKSLSEYLRPVDMSSCGSLDVLEEELEGRIIRYYGMKYRRVG